MSTKCPRGGGSCIIRQGGSHNLAVFAPQVTTLKPTTLHFYWVTPVWERRYPRPVCSVNMVSASVIARVRPAAAGCAEMRTPLLSGGRTPHLAPASPAGVQTVQVGAGVLKCDRRHLPVPEASHRMPPSALVKGVSKGVARSTCTLRQAQDHALRYGRSLRFGLLRIHFFSMVATWVT